MAQSFIDRDFNIVRTECSRCAVPMGREAPLRSKSDRISAPQRNDGPLATVGIAARILLDHLGLQDWGDGEAQCLRSLRVDYEAIPIRKLNREIARLRASKNAIDVAVASRN